MLEKGSDIWCRRAGLSWAQKELADKAKCTESEIKNLEKLDDFSNDNIAALRKINRAINEETLINRKKREFSEEWEKFKINNVDDDPWKLPHKFLDIKFRLSEMFEDREREYIDRRQVGDVQDVLWRNPYTKPMHIHPRRMGLRR